MSKVKVELNLKGINELMKSSEIQGACTEAAQAVADAAGDEYAVRSGTINFIAFANAYPDSKKAAHENFENNSLLKAISAVGLPQSK